MNDLWMYSIDNDTWIWVGGSDTVYIDGVYGEKGFPSQNNIPSPRGESGKWIDKANRKFWLFGGMNELSTCNNIYLLIIKYKIILIIISFYKR